MPAVNVPLPFDIVQALRERAAAEKTSLPALLRGFLGLAAVPRGAALGGRGATTRIPLPDGTPLRMTHRGVSVEATIESGRLRLPGVEKLLAPSTAANRALARRGVSAKASFNGWETWTYETPGGWVPLVTLRLEGSVPLPDSARKRTFHTWTPEEDAYLRANRGKVTAAKMAEHLGLGFSAVRSHLGILLRQDEVPESHDSGAE